MILENLLVHTMIPCGFGCDLLQSSVHGNVLGSAVCISFLHASAFLPLTSQHSRLHTTSASYSQVLRIELSYLPGVCK